MVIAVNTDFWGKEYPEEWDCFFYECISRIAEEHPQHQFIFIFDRPYDKAAAFGKNVTSIVAGTASSHFLLRKWRLDIKVPAVLKKYKAGVFVSAGACSLTTKVPQCLIVHNLSYASHSFLWKRWLPAFFQKAKTIVVPSQHLKKNMLANYEGMAADKINVVYAAVKESFHPAGIAEPETTRLKYSDGKNYFVYSGDFHLQHLLQLLKAFSVFKKRQQTDWKLLIAGKAGGKNNDFSEKLKSYKYRADVIVIGDIEEGERIKIIGSSYAMIYLPVQESFTVKPLEAMHCGIPVLASSSAWLQEMYGDALLYTDSNDHNDIADKMMRLYKDEPMRNRMIERGKQLTAKYTWEKSTSLLWQSIADALH